MTFCSEGGWEGVAENEQHTASKRSHVWMYIVYGMILDVHVF